MIVRDMIHEIAWAGNGARVALGLFEQPVEIWDPGAREQVSTFSTILDLGGKRLALSSDGTILVAASYHRDGVAAYDAVRGVPIWQRQDVKKVQHMSASRRNALIYLARELGPGLVLDIRTGETVAQRRGVKAIWESAYGPLMIDGVKPGVFNFDVSNIDVFTRRFVVERSSFAILACAFSADALAVAEAAGAVQCICLRTAKPLWRAELTRGMHCLALGYSKSLNTFVGVLWSYQSGGSKLLVHFDVDGTNRTIAILGQPTATCFDPDAAHLLTSDRLVFSVLTGQCSPLQADAPTAVR